MQTIMMKIADEAEKVVDRLRPFRTFVILLCDATATVASFWMAFQVRFDFNIPPGEWTVFLKVLPFVLLIRLFTFVSFRLQTGLWKYISVPDFLVILKAITVGSVINITVILMIIGHGFSRAVFLLDWMFCLFTVSGMRLTIRILRETYLRMRLQSRPLSRRRVIIIGAGDMGEMLLRDIRRNPESRYRYEVVGFVDDGFGRRRSIHGGEILGPIESLSHLCEKHRVGEILIAVDWPDREERRRILRHCRETGRPFKTVPSMHELLNGLARIGHLQDVEPEDIIGRETVGIPLARLQQEFRGKCLLVTGAGGSIGSELCRQLCQFDPERLILFDRAENSLYLLELELTQLYPSVNIISVVGDIIDRQGLEEMIRSHAPEFVFHAAAYKHVPLMEANPLEAIRNNVLGTENVGLASLGGGVKKVILVSTDKAVNPVGVMGMTKRVAEYLVHTIGKESTRFVTVRFGNVLGSNGSVLPIFRRQIAEGGPLTVTDERATRYFMLVSEAAKLIIQASVIGKGGETFFLDMGEPLRIMDLAEKLVSFSGMEVNKDIDIEVSGLRPGERLEEKLFTDRESLQPTEHEKIFCVSVNSLDFESFAVDMDALRSSLAVRNPEAALAKLKEMTDKY